MTTLKPICYNVELSNRDDSVIKSTVSPILLTQPRVESTPNNIDPQNVAQKDLFARLPNELFESILMRLKVQKMIPFRLVSPRWLMMIESICNKKKSLALVSPNFWVNLNDRLLNLSHYLQLKPTIFTISKLMANVDLRTLLGKLFPRIENLFVDEITVLEKADILVPLLSALSSTLVTLYFDEKMNIDAQAAICSQINAMTNLENLNLPNHLSLKSLGPTLHRLYSLSFDMFESPRATSVLLVDNLGPKCTKLSVNIRMNHHISLLPILIAQSPISYLHLNFFVSSIDDSLLRDFSRQFEHSLKSIHITNHIAHNLIYSTTIAQLFILNQLTNIRIDGKVNFFLNRIFRIEEPMPNIRSLTLHNFRFASSAENNAELFCQFLTKTFPNLEELTLSYIDPLFGPKVEQFLNLFKALRYHDISHVL